MKKRVAVYARVSTDEQQRKETIDAQIEALRRTLPGDFEVVETYLDDGISGAVGFEERPGGSRLLRDVETGRFEEVLAYKLDRLGRNTINILSLAQRLRDSGVGLRVQQFLFDGTPMGKLLLNLLSSIAEFERSLIRDRTMDGRRSRAAKGGYTGGRKAWGYDWKDGVWVIDQSIAERVRYMFGRYTGGMSFKALARDLNEKGVATPRNAKGWRGSSVQAIIAQPAYAGIYYSNRGKDFSSLLNFYTVAQLEAAAEEHGWVRVPGFPAIIDESTWESAQSTRLSSARKNRGRPTVHWVLPMVRCGQCVGKATANRNRQGRRYYYCRRNHDIPGISECAGFALSAEVVERLTLAALHNFLNDDAAVRMAFQERLRNVETEMAELSLLCAPVEEEIRSIEEQKRRAGEAYVKQVWSKERFDDEVAAIDKRRKALEQRRGDYDANIQRLRQVKSEGDRLERALKEGRLHLTRRGQLKTARSNDDSLKGNEKGRGLHKGIEAFETMAYVSSDAVWSGQHDLMEALELTVHVWPDRLELRGWGSVTLTGELETGDINLEIEGLKPHGDDESYLQKESRNSWMTLPNAGSSWVSRRN